MQNTTQIWKIPRGKNPNGLLKHPVNSLSLQSKSKVWSYGFPFLSFFSTSLMPAALHSLHSQNISLKVMTWHSNHSWIIDFCLQTRSAMFLSEGEFRFRTRYAIVPVTSAWSSHRFTAPSSAVSVHEAGSDRRSGAQGYQTAWNDTTKWNLKQ